MWGFLQCKMNTEVIGREVARTPKAANACFWVKAWNETRKLNLIPETTALDFIYEALMAAMKPNTRSLSSGNWLITAFCKPDIYNLSLHYYFQGWAWSYWATEHQSPPYLSMRTQDTKKLCRNSMCSSQTCWTKPHQVSWAHTFWYLLVQRDMLQKHTWDK